MFPPKGSGLEQIQKTLGEFNQGYSMSRLLENSPVKQLLSSRPFSGQPMNITDIQQPMQNLQQTIQKMASDLSQGFGSMLSMFTGSEEDEDYDTIAESFLPSGTILITPQYPAGSEKTLLTDLDGDNRKEIVASYNKDGSFRTMILKKYDNGVWEKYSEINLPGYTGLHYRNDVNITGKGHKQLLLGLANAQGSKKLHGYSLDSGNADHMFEQHYDKIQVMDSSSKKAFKDRASIALWRLNNEGTYDIDLVNWDGRQLTEKAKDSYYINTVLPYYAKKVRQQPNLPHTWFELADALIKSGEHRDAKKVIEEGMKRDKQKEYEQNFRNLKNRL